MARVALQFDPAGWYLAAAEKEGVPTLIPGPDGLFPHVCTLDPAPPADPAPGAEEEAPEPPEPPEPPETPEPQAEPDAPETPEPRVYHGLGEVLAAGPEVLAGFFRRAALEAQLFTGQAVEEIGLVIPAAFTQREIRWLHGAAASLGLPLRLIRGADALAWAYVSDPELTEPPGCFAAFHMDGEEAEVGLYRLEGRALYTEALRSFRSPEKTLLEVISRSLILALGRDPETVETDLQRRCQARARELLTLPEADYPFRVELGTLVPGTRGTAIFQWSEVIKTAGRMPIRELLQGTEGETESLMLLSDGYGRTSPVIEAAIRRQNPGGHTSFLREKPYPLLASCLDWAGDEAPTLHPCMPHALSVDSGGAQVELRPENAPVGENRALRLTARTLFPAPLEMVIREGGTAVLSLTLPLEAGPEELLLRITSTPGLLSTATLESLTTGKTYTLLPCRDEDLSAPRDVGSRPLIYVVE